MKRERWCLRNSAVCSGIIAPFSGFLIGGKENCQQCAQLSLIGGRENCQRCAPSSLPTKGALSPLCTPFLTHGKQKCHRCAHLSSPTGEREQYVHRYPHTGRGRAVCAPLPHTGGEGALCASLPTHHGEDWHHSAHHPTHHGETGTTLRRGVSLPGEVYTTVHT